MRTSVRLPHRDRSSTPMSADVERLMAPDPYLGVPIPAYAGRSLPNLASTLASRLGDRRSGPLPLPTLSADVDPFDGRRPEGPVVVLLVDGLGWNAVLGSAKRHPSGPAARWVATASPVTSVFPTTTTVALTSLSSGSAPGQHGVVGHRVYLPHFGSVVEVLRMSPLGVRAPETLVGPEWSPALISGVPSIFRRGVPGLALTRDRFEGSGFTRLIYDGADFEAFSTMSDLALALVEVLSRAEPPALTYVYWDDLDVAQHVRGPHPSLVDIELDHVDAVLRFVAQHLEAKVGRAARLLVTGDHGQVPLESSHQLVADQDRPLLALLSRPPAGDRRATFFAARSGQRSALQEALAERIPTGGRLLEMAEAVERGLFGPAPHHPELLDRLGDFLVLLPSPGGVSYTVPGSRPRAHPMRGAHGGLEPDELIVPLVSTSFADAPGNPPPSTHLSGRRPAVK